MIKNIHILLFSFLCIGASAQNADSLINQSTSGFLPDATITYLRQYCDTSRHGYKGPIVIAVDEFNQPVDSVSVVNKPSEFEPSAVQLKKRKVRFVTNKYGYARCKGVTGNAPDIIGFKGDTVFFFKASQYDGSEGAYINCVYILKPQREAKKGVKINMHNQDSTK